MVSTERLIIVDQLRQRTTLNLTRVPELPKSSIVLGTDIEGPLFLGDFIAEAMANNLKPKDGGVDATPSYGQLIYEEGWNWFTGETLPERRGAEIRLSRQTLSLSQEGTDTIFTLPMLLAEGIYYEDLERLTMQSRLTPGAKEFLEELRTQGVNIFGITTAPQEPYRKLVSKTGVLDPAMVIGSPFPIEEARRALLKSGRWGYEMSMTKMFLEECYEIIDSNSYCEETNGHTARNLNDNGRKLLRNRIGIYLSEELGVSYSQEERLSRGRPPKTVLGQIIEASGMVGDRAKAAIAQTAYRMNGLLGGNLITMGDGANDAEMLRRASISIGLNGADAARAAKIAVVTDDMRNVLSIFEQVKNGERELQAIVKNAQQAVGSGALITLGGPDTSDKIIQEHKKMKRALRGRNVTY